MLLLTHKKCQKATLSFAYKRARPPGPAALRIETVRPAYGTTQLKDAERVLVGTKRMNVASCRILTSPGRCNEVSGGCTLVVGGRWFELVTG